MRTRLKICCISSLDEARLAIRLGADALGLVGEMPSGPGVVGDTVAAQIVQITPPPIATFMLTSQTTVDGIMAHQKRVGANTIQLVDAVPAEAYQQLHQALPAVKLVQVIHVLDQANIDEALLAVHNGADALLLDSGNPTLAVKELGGTGRVHNWLISRRIVELSPVPVFLAGGLHPSNAREAVDTVRPFGLDICSGVRTNGRLDEHKLTAFITALAG
ncbi:phosphoribosylanthranilate isomerase [Spirosoma utsteinense]|uniref:N-(5'-phosphoribosyl)anthranilate isomerase n=1 Tax=Spirosoma utsteinense TaxID=2585773 RepID=A0ABR6W294_9BACT|nr:phosphoribosylanthranilate isomerase [Spirosoma utsteinense]MBC3786020.1 phosphoribosylanthranilate isomerase [Spirosoma utsteinense]MBC3790718.1 phosphoribosylanthranilate isomerase [Spirosoma utsteinense]